MAESNSQKAIKGMSSQTLVTIVLGVVEIGSFSVMSRLLSQKDFGYYAAISAVTAVFSVLSTAGIGSAIVQRKNLDQKFLNNAFTLCLVFGTVACIAMFLSSNILASTIVDNTMATPLKVMSVTLLTGSLSSSYLSTLQKRLKFLTIGMIHLVSLIVTTILAIVLAYYGHGYYAIITKTVSASVLTLVLGAIISRTRFSLEWDKDTIKSIWGFSSWLMFSAIFRDFAHQMDRLLMSRLLSVDALGAYNRPKEFITQISTKLNGIFDTALFPVLSNVQDDYSRVRSAYKKAISYLNILSIVLMMSFFFNAELLVRIFFGEQWLSIVPTFRILSCSLIFNIDGRLADCFLRSLGWTKQQFYFRIVEMFAQLLGLFVSARYGINGVAVSVVLVNILCIWMKNLYITVHIGVPHKDSIYIILSSWKVMYFVAPIMTFLLIVLPHTLPFNSLNAIVYVILIIVPFVFVPSIVGEDYKSEVHVKVINAITNKVSRKR